MKKIIYLLTFLLAFVSCNSESNKTEQNNGNTNTTAEKTAKQEAESASIAYRDCSLAYLKDGKLYFYQIEQDKAVAFTEESDTIINFVFNNAGNTLYYGVEKDSILWLKSVNIDLEEPRPEWLISWNLKRRDYCSEASGKNSPLYLYKGNNVVIRHNYSWDYYDFKSMAFYSIADKKITQKNFNYEIIQKLTNQEPDDKVNQNFKIIDKQLYYIKDGNKACLTNWLELEKLRNKSKEDYWIDTEFDSFILSKDKTKVAFGCVFGFGDLPHGVYCIANIDGSKQMVLENTDLSYNQMVWVDNLFAFIDLNNNLLIANNDKKTVVKIAENVSSLKNRVNK